MTIEAADLAKISDMLQSALAARTAQAATPAWGAPAQPIASAQAPMPTGVMFRFKVQLPDGSALPGYLCFGAEVVKDPATLAAAASAIAQMFPVDRYEARPQNSWGNGGGNGYGGYRGGWRGQGRRW